MSYTGEVHPGGPADVRELPHLIITKVAVDPKMSNNAYVLTCRATGKQLLIDAAAESERLIPMLRRPVVVFTTHRHWDHHRALADVVEATDATTIAGADDAEAIAEATGLQIDRRTRHGETVTVGDCRLQVIGLRGHTPGSMALLYSDPEGGLHLFTGDSLFPGGPGRTTSQADFTSLMDDLEERIFDRLPDSTWFYPGHGNDSTLAAERPHLSEWRTRGW